MDDEYTPLWGGSIEDFVERVKKVEENIVRGRAEQFMREGKNETVAYDLANQELRDTVNSKLSDNRTRRTEKTSTAVATVPSDTYNANLTAPTQKPDSIHFMTFADGTRISRFMNPAEAGVSFENAQSENYGKLKDERELLRKERENELAVKKARALYIEEEEHKRALKEIEDTSGIVDFNTGQILPSGTNAVNDRKMLLDLLYKFTMDKRIVLENKRRDTDEVVVYMWNADECIYFKISLPRLKMEIKEFFYKNGWTENFPMTDNKVAEYADMIKTIVAPTLDKSGLKIADGNQTFFHNGYYDIRKGEFIACNTKAVSGVLCN